MELLPLFLSRGQDTSARNLLVSSISVPTIYPGNWGESHRGAYIHWILIFFYHAIPKKLPLKLAERRVKSPGSSISLDFVFLKSLGMSPFPGLVTLIKVSSAEEEKGLLAVFQGHFSRVFGELIKIRIAKPQPRVPNAVVVGLSLRICVPGKVLIGAVAARLGFHFGNHCVRATSRCSG